MSSPNHEDPLEAISEACNEAERLLEELDAEDKYRSELREEPHEVARFTDAPQKNDQTKARPEGSGCLAIVGGAALIGVIAIASQNQYATQEAYEAAMKAGKDAVLVAEHKKAIDMLEAIKRKGLNPDTMDNGQLNNRIIRSKKLIRYLDQRGKYRYQEESDYGYQWYNKDSKNGFRVFFAHSRRCKNPLVTFGYSTTQNGRTIGTRSVRPKATMSTIIAPYQGSSWIHVSRFRCN